MKQINCSVDSSIYKNFQKFYPYCLTRFVRNCIKLAVEDRQFFNQMFFLECEK